MGVPSRRFVVAAALATALLAEAHGAAAADDGSSVTEGVGLESLTGYGFANAAPAGGAYLNTMGPTAGLRAALQIYGVRSTYFVAARGQLYGGESTDLAAPGTHATAHMRLLDFEGGLGRRFGAFEVRADAGFGFALFDRAATGPGLSDTDHDASFSFTAGLEGLRYLDGGRHFFLGVNPRLEGFLLLTSGITRTFSGLSFDGVVGTQF